MRRALAFGVLCCLMLGLMSLGCGGVDENARVARPVSEEGLKLPESTLVRLQECADEYAPRLSASKYKLDFAVEAGSSGQVLQVTKADIDPFNQDVGTCMMLAIRATTVPVSELRTRSGPAVSKNTLPPAARGQVGFAIPIAAGLAEIMLVSGAVTFILVVAVALVDEALDEEEKVKRMCQEEYAMCLLTGLADLTGGSNGETRCITCRQACRKNNGEWKSWAEVTNGKVRCDYWNFKR